VETEPSIHFFCALCGTGLTVSAQLQGNIVECAGCSRSIPVPGHLSREGPIGEYLPLYSPDVLSVEMTFVCPGCEGALVSDARYEGTPFSCPKCSFSGSVPTWSGFVAPDARAERRAPAVVLSTDEIDFLIGENTDAAISPG
jgi:predicted RNA-binding Zn-ribbon protein involved in translation (DUF1610 family)